MRAALFLVLVALAAVYGQNVVRFTIDDFSVGAGDHDVSVLLEETIDASDGPVSSSSSFSQAGCNGLVGCARDMRMTVTSGSQGRTCTSNIFTVADSELFVGEWAVSNPKNFRTVTLLQYDGPDNSIDLDLVGLNSIDMTDGGLATGVQVTIISDLESIYQFDIYSPDGGVCQRTIQSNAITGEYDLEEIFLYIDYSEFEGNCDLTNVGAIEIALPSFDALDAIMRSFRAVGLPDPDVPSPSPSPVVEPEVCDCNCPVFRCGLVYAVPGDDDDDVDDDTVDDDDIVYRPVYYGPVDDDFNNIFGDDDDFELISRMGGLTVNHRDDDDASAAGSLAAFTTLLTVAIALI